MVYFWHYMKPFRTLLHLIFKTTHEGVIHIIANYMWRNWDQENQNTCWRSYDHIRQSQGRNRDLGIWSIHKASPMQEKGPKGRSIETVHSLSLPGSRDTYHFPSRPSASSSIKWGCKFLQRLFQILNCYTTSGLCFHRPHKDDLPNVWYA